MVRRQKFGSHGIFTLLRIFEPLAEHSVAKAPYRKGMAEAKIRESHGPSKQFLMVALGASAGGLEACESFFQHMPDDAGMAFAVVMHLAPDRASALAEILGRHTRMAVEQAQDNTKVLPNHVYIIPPNATLTINDTC